MAGRGGDLFTAKSVGISDMLFRSGETDHHLVPSDGDISPSCCSSSALLSKWLKRCVITVLVCGGVGRGERCWGRRVRAHLPELIVKCRFSM